MFESFNDFLIPLRNFLSAHSWLAAIFIIAFLILVFRYLKALFSIIFFLVIFIGVILAITRYQVRPGQVHKSNQEPVPQRTWYR